MLSIPSNIQTLLDGGRFSIRWLVRFDLDSGATGVWGDTYFVTVAGVTYAPLGGNIQVDAIPGQVSLGASSVAVTVTNLLSAVTTVIAGEDWHQRPASVILAILDDAGAVQHTITRFSGFLDEIEISDAAGDLCTVVFKIESSFRELNRATGRTRSDGDQRKISATDDFFKHAANANTDTDIYWGRKGVQPVAKKPSGVAKFLGKIL